MKLKNYKNNIVFLNKKKTFILIEEIATSTPLYIKWQIALAENNMESSFIKNKAAGFNFKTIFNLVNTKFVKNLFKSTVRLVQFKNKTNDCLFTKFNNFIEKQPLDIQKKFLIVAYGFETKIYSQFLINKILKNKSYKTTILFNFNKINIYINDLFYLIVFFLSKINF
jgi:hypothetical protein